MRLQDSSPVASPYLGAAGVIAAVTAFGYARLLGQQGDWPGLDGRQALVLGLLIGFAIVGAIGTFARQVRLRVATAAACASGLLALGVLGMFSIGMVLLVAGALALIAWSRAGPTDRGVERLVLSAASALFAIAVLVVGFVATG